MRWIVNIMLYHCVYIVSALGSRSPATLLMCDLSMGTSALSPREHALQSDSNLLDTTGLPLLKREAPSIHAPLKPRAQWYVYHPFGISRHPHSDSTSCIHSIHRHKSSDDRRNKSDKEQVLQPKAIGILVPRGCQGSDHLLERFNSLLLERLLRNMEGRETIHGP